LRSFRAGGHRMNWISNVVRPKIRNLLGRREVPDNLWIKCPDTGQLVFAKDVEANQFVIPSSNHHMHMSADARLKSIFDNQTWIDVALPSVAIDPLAFRDHKNRKYGERLKAASTKTVASVASRIGSAPAATFFMPS